MYSGSRAHLYCPVEAYAYMFPYRIFGVFLYSRVARLIFTTVVGPADIFFMIITVGILVYQDYRAHFIAIWGSTNTSFYIEYVGYLCICRVYLYRPPWVLRIRGLY